MAASHKESGDDDDYRSVESRERLLQTSDYDADFHTARKSRQTLFTGKPIYLHLGLIFIYTFTYLVVLLGTVYINSGSHCTTPSDSTRSHYALPDKTKVTWKPHQFVNNIDHNPFVGDPRPELEEAWHGFLINDNMRIPRRMLDEKDLESVYTTDGKEGIASLGTFHALHCLKKIRQMTFKEHYHEGKDEMTMRREMRHVNHCIEYIRESLMCKPDLSLLTYRWINDTHEHEDKAEFWPSPVDIDYHQCADWEAVNNWAGDHFFDLSDVDQLRRPVRED